MVAILLATIPIAIDCRITVEMLKKFYGWTLNLHRCFIHELEWLGSPTTSSACTAVCGLCKTFGLQQLVDRGTRKSAILDLVITEYSGTVT